MYKRVTLARNKVLFGVIRSELGSLNKRNEYYISRKQAREKQPSIEESLFGTKVNMARSYSKSIL